MTVQEFEQWVEQHRGEMERYAKSRVNGVGVSPEDVVNNTLVRLMVKDGGKRIEKIFPHAVKAYVWFAIRSVAANAIQEDQRRRDREIAYHSNEAHGTSGFTTETSMRALARQGKPAAVEYAAQLQTEGASLAEQISLEGNPGGIARWRFQQRRDARRFDGAAVRSLSESIRGVSRRYRHHGRQGFSFVQFGEEVCGVGHPYVEGDVPWTQVAGYKFMRDVKDAMSYDVTLDPESRNNSWDDGDIQVPS